MLPPIQIGIGAGASTTENPAGGLRTARTHSSVGAAAVVVARAEHLELAAQVADPDAEDQSVTRKAAERPRHRGHDQGVTVRRDQDVGTEPQSRVVAESPRTRRQRLEERRREVHRRRVVGNRDVIGEPGRVETQLLAGRDELGDRGTVGTGAEGVAVAELVAAGEDLGYDSAWLA